MADSSLFADRLTGSQKHELAKIVDGGGVIVEGPDEWCEPTGTVPKDSIVVTYHIPSATHSGWYVEAIVTPDGERLLVR